MGWNLAFGGLIYDMWEFACRFLAQTGLVSVEHQMREMDFMPNGGSEMSKKGK